MSEGGVTAWVWVLLGAGCKWVYQTNPSEGLYFSYVCRTLVVRVTGALKSPSATLTDKKGCTF